MPGRASLPEVLFGPHAVKAAIIAGRRKARRILTVPEADRNRRQQEIVELAEQRGIPVETAQPARLEKTAGGSGHQGVIAEVGAYPLVSLGDILAGVTPGNDPFLLIADGIVDPHNLGALARTALCAGLDGLVIPRDNAVGPTPAVSRASAGALEYLRLARVTNISRTINRLKENGVWTAGLEAEGDKSLFEADLNGPLALVVGGEEKGIRRLVKKQCDFMIYIPQDATIDSLNVSVAGGVAMYEILRQRRVSGAAETDKRKD